MNMKILKCSLFILLTVFAVQLGFAQEPQTELLWPEGAPNALGDADNDKPQLIMYQADASKATGVGIVILPGGGYGGLAMGHEGHDFAAWFNERGISAFICDYRHRGKGYGHPAPMLDAQRAIRTVRSRAKEFGVNPEKIGIIGFSAGGHLASTVSTHFDQGTADAADPIQRVSSRPDFAILCYPVISLGQAHTHLGSQKNLLGENPDPALIEKFSNEKQVTKENPPTFLWHTVEDKGVPVENSLVFFRALVAVGVPAELHAYEKGRHGLGLALDVPGTSNWSNELLAWMKQRRILE
jgi:acetyl esterase/lipase